MERGIVESLQNLQLTKEEEENISISAISKTELLEECSLSLFGRLLSDRQQNLKALKSTLRSVWKMGSDLRIVEVGNNVLQFKFSSRYQMEWVERSGPWNFENNLLLLCRWRKGLSSANISFTHSPFWVQVWGLPFENMTEEVGRVIGSKIGHVLEVDRRSWQDEQAKFMRIKVEIPIDKPLRRGGYITNEEGGRSWVTFKYERLPTFCYNCGILGHDNRHCHMSLDGQRTKSQYGEWLKAGSVIKGGSDRIRPSTSKGKESSEVENNGGRLQTESGKVGNSSSNQFQTGGGEAKLQKESQVSGNVDTVMSDSLPADNPGRWDRREKEGQDLRQKEGNSNGGVGTKQDSVREVFIKKENALSSVGRSLKPNEDIQELTSPNKSMLKTKENKVCNSSDLDSVKFEKTQSKGKLKKIARELGKTQNQTSCAQVPSVGNKREKRTEDDEDYCERPVKCVCDAHAMDDDQIDELSAVTAM